MRQGITLTEDSIFRQLTAIVEDLEAVHLDTADTKLSMLAFDRLVRPAQIGDSELWTAFNQNRVNDTGVQLASCEDAIARGNADVALLSAQRALTRWTRPKGK